MLDLAFLAVAIFVFIKANKGEYNETACNIALVVGIIAGVVGCISGISAGRGMFVFLNVIVIIGAFGLRFAAKLLARLYVEKLIADEEAREREIRMHTRFDNSKGPVYTDETFDDEELRFGKGGYTDNNKVSLDKTEIYTGRNFVDVEPLFGNSGYTDHNKVSLEKKEICTDRNFDDAEPLFGKDSYTDTKKVCLDKKKVCLDKKEIFDDRNFDDEELRFGNGGYTDPKL